MHARSYLRLAVVLPTLCGSLLFSQSVRPADPRINIGVPPDLSNPFRFTNAQNSERQKSLVKDTQRLLTITNELNDAANNNSPNASPQEVLKKIEEIEKLAKRINKEMKGE